MRVIWAIVLLLIVPASVSAAEPTKQELLVAIEKQLKTVNERAGPSIACIVASRSNRYPKVPGAAEQPGKLGGYDPAEFLKAHPNEARLAGALDLSKPTNIADHGYACGVVIDAAGLILTPYHALDGATKVYVYLPGGRGSYADIHAADARSDLAVLKLLNPPPGMTAIKFADVKLPKHHPNGATVYPGKLAILMANPYVPGFALDKPSAALGSIQTVRNPDSKEGDKPSSYYHYGPLLAHDIKLHAEIDGAALLNLDGELIGLATTGAGIAGGERGASSALPADHNFRRIVEVLRKGEEVEYGMMGINLPVNADALQITAVTPGGPAAQGGIRVNDFVTHVNAIPIRNYEDLFHQIGSALAGNRVSVTVSRGGRSLDFDLTLGKFKPQPYIASVRPEPVHGLRVEYTSALVQTGPVPEGVYVRDIVPDSPAAAAFKKLGDAPERWVVTRVNDTAVTTPAEFYKAAKGKPSVRLTVTDPSDPKSRDREVTLP